MSPLPHRLPPTTGVLSAAAVLVALGACVLLGWALGVPAMVRVFPNTTAMAINTAAMFFTVGLALAATGLAHPVARPVRALLGLVLLVWPALILLQHLTGADLGIDWAAAHQRLGDGHAKPGRMAPNASLGFMLAGIVVLLSRRGVPGARGIQIASWLAGAVLAIGSTAFLGYWLKLEMLYRVASYNQMAALTAVGMTVVGLGLVGLVVQWRASLPPKLPDASRATWLAAGLLSLFALATGLVAFGLLKGGYEESASDSILHNASKSAVAVAALLDKNVALGKAIAGRPLLGAAVARLTGDPNDHLAAQQLRSEEQSFLALGYTGIRITAADGRLLGSAGDLVEQPALDAPLDQPGMQARLLWQQRLLFRTEHPLYDRGVRVGRLVLERPMAPLSAFMERAQRATGSGDFVLCYRQDTQVVCFPSRFYREPMRFAMFKRDGSPALPIARALLGQVGVQQLKDPRGISVIAAYTPIGTYPLAAVEKLETQELYEPLRAVMPQLMTTMLMLVLAGTLLLRRWVRPIIERIAAERARSAAVLDHSIDAFIALDEARRITEWNQQAQRLLGWRRDEALGQDAAQLLGLSAMPWLPAQAGASGTRVQTEVRTRDGAALPVELSVAAVQGQEGLATSVFVRDLREVRERERQLSQTQAALVQAQKLEAIGKLTGGVAHDFNNVLQVIGSNLQLIQAKADERGRTLAQAALGAVDRGAKLSSQLLAFARRQPLQPVSFDVNRRLARMDDLLRRSLGERIEIETIRAGGLWTTLADPNQLENVVLNLCINARDAMPEGGRLTLETANCTLDEAYCQGVEDVRPGQYVMIAVTDNGSGMPPEVLARVFEPFYTTKPEGKGTGLGLSMAYGFAKQSGGHIRIYSEPGNGTTVKLYLPRSFEAEVELPAEPSGPVTGGNETILVVEDDPAVQAAAVRMLQALGYRTLRAGDAQAALTILQSGAAVDLLFTDVVMPGPLRSPELAQRARTLHPEIRVLFTSGYTQNAIVHGGRLDPGVELLSKPYRQEDLARKVRRLLDERKRPTSSTAPPAALHEAAPVAEPQRQTPPDPQDLQPPLDRQVRVLFVEDQEDVREATHELLQILGAITVSAGSAEQAEQALARERFDLLLTDLSLPGRDGVALAQAARRLQPALRIAYATGLGASFTPPAGLEGQVLCKPYQLEDLQQLLVSVELDTQA